MERAIGVEHRATPVITQRRAADAHRHLAAPHLLQGLPDLLGHAAGLGLRARRQEDRELVATDACDRVAGTNRAADGPPEPDQQRLADLVTLGVVDARETQRLRRFPPLFAGVRGSLTNRGD